MRNHEPPLHFRRDELTPSQNIPRPELRSGRCASLGALAALSEVGLPAAQEEAHKCVTMRASIRGSRFLLCYEMDRQGRARKKRRKKKENVAALDLFYHHLQSTHKGPYHSPGAAALVLSGSLSTPQSIIPSSTEERACPPPTSIARCTGKHDNPRALVFSVTRDRYR